MRQREAVRIGLSAVVCLTLGISGAAQKGKRFGATMVGVDTAAAGGAGSQDDAQARGLARARQLQARNAQRLMDVPGAIGHAVGIGNGPVIQILVEQITPGARAQMPGELEGIPVVLEEVGQVRAFPSCRKEK